MRYPIVIHKDSDSDFGATVPDVPGCFSVGESMEEAIAMAQEAIECHLEGMLMDGEALPLPTPIESHQGKDEYGGGVWALVDIDMSKLSAQSKRVDVTMPGFLLDAVDQYARKHGESRSGVLVQAVTEYMAAHRST
ncbi:type II toxin-antitoxin system HicB family antitoxin [Desulfonatronum thiodismutans]|uniref:type II toxin-antitoxin system HicB family antitoxin n=1 Tax=Desulfonatronum thiodismutans TaxID=159290 RepID=UPI0004ABD568|nr:type II toxin-antitoxin system HicB family antitoxin [Desulfonatronum thiodismutans]